jgi:hypothetical protein
VLKLYAEANLRPSGYERIKAIFEALDRWAITNTDKELRFRDSPPKHAKNHENPTLIETKLKQDEKT